MRLLRSIMLYLTAGAAGVATLAALAAEWLPPGLIAVAFALFFILMLPKRPRIVAAFCGGAALAVASTFVTFTASEWDNCADEVNGKLIQSKCSEGPPERQGKMVRLQRG